MCVKKMVQKQKNLQNLNEEVIPVEPNMLKELYDDLAKEAEIQ